MNAKSIVDKYISECSFPERVRNKLNEITDIDAFVNNSQNAEIVDFFMDVQENDLALLLINEFLQSSGQSLEWLYRKCTVTYRLQKFDEFIDAANFILRGKPEEDKWLLINTAEISIKKGNPNYAIELLGRIYNHNSISHFWFGEAYRQIGNYKKASHHYDSYLSSEPTYRGKSQIFYKSKNLVKSRVTPENLKFDQRLADNNAIFVSSMPRSGVNYITGLIHNLTAKPFYYAYNEGDDDQQLDISPFLDGLKENAIISHHTRANNKTVSMLQATQTKCVIVINNIFESLLSYTYHIDEHKSPRILNNDWNLLSRSQKLDQVIELQTFWYLDFYTTWKRALDNNLIDFLLIHFNELKSSPINTLKKISDYIEFDADDDTLQRKLLQTYKSASALIIKEMEEALTLDTESTLSQFTEDQIKRVRHTASLVTDIDLSPIGL